MQSFNAPPHGETDLNRGDFGLDFAGRSSTDTRGELGTHFEHLTMVDGLPLKLRGRIAWAHDWVSDPSLFATFQALSGASFIVRGYAGKGFRDRLRWPRTAYDISAYVGCQIRR